MTVASYADLNHGIEVEKVEATAEFLVVLRVFDTADVSERRWKEIAAERLYAEDRPQNVEYHLEDLVRVQHQRLWWRRHVGDIGSRRV